MARKRKNNSIAEVLACLSRATLPSKPIDAIQWLENTRWLSPESSREVGPFRFDRAPYLEEPQRAILDASTPEVVLDWASQCGKSEVWLNGCRRWILKA
jgi:phage terminase large subunit GpA-like protein